jgi:excisionase family DNA binding protein
VELRHQRRLEMAQGESQTLNLLTVEQLARELAVAPKTVRKWRSMQQAPKSLKVGRRILFRREDVQTWLDSQAEEQAEIQAANS